MLRALLICTLTCLLLNSCAWFRSRNLDYTQGNILKERNLVQLKRGMKKSEVSFVLGTPVLMNSFDPNRWEYVQVMQKGTTSTIEKRVIIFFRGDKVSHFTIERFQKAKR